MLLLTLTPDNWADII